jgi:hypothetical protein
MIKKKRKNRTLENKKPEGQFKFKNKEGLNEDITSNNY